MHHRTSASCGISNPSLFLLPLQIPLKTHQFLHSTTTNSEHHHLSITIVLVYFFLGLLLGGDTVMYSYGLCFLPVSTYSLVCATQLAFNALFSFFINSQKFTPFIVELPSPPHHLCYLTCSRRKLRRS